MTRYIPGSAVPIPARLAGYNTCTFSTLPSNGGFSPSNVYTGSSPTAGYQWYVDNFFGAQPDQASVTFSGGVVSCQGTTTNNSNNQLCSATQIGSAPYFHGTAFGGGGYFEAVLSFDGTEVNTAHGFPAWWRMSLEHLIGGIGDQYPGQTAGPPPFEAFGEQDDMEADVNSGASQSVAASLHTYSGQFTHGFTELSANDYNVAAPSSAWTNFHTVGGLWIPATASTNGSAQTWLDGVPMGPAKTWSQFTSQPPPQVAPWGLGLGDRLHYVMIIGAGTNTPINVRQVRVFQKSAANNVTN